MRSLDEARAIDNVMATGDATAIELLEKFMDTAQEHYCNGISGLDGIQDVMPALYALNRHLLAHFPDRFPSGFFVGNEPEVHDFIGKLLVSVFQKRQGPLRNISSLSVQRITA